MENKTNTSINYIEIIKKAFGMVWQNRYLWWLGFFMAFSGIGLRTSNFSSSKETSPENMEKIWNFISANLSWIIPLAVFLILLLILFLVLGTIARAGVIRSVEKIEKKENFGFKEAMKEGKKYFWKFLFLGIALSIALILILTIMAIPIALLFSAHSYIIGGILTFIAILIFVPLAVIFIFIKSFGQIYLVLGNLSLRSSIENGYHLFLKNIKKSIVMSLIFILISMLLCFAVLLSILAFVIIFGLLGLLLFLVLKIIGIIIAAGLAILVLLVFFLIVSSFFQAFSQIAWVLFFKEIAAPKVEEVLEEIAQEEILKQKTPEPASEITASKID